MAYTAGARLKKAYPDKAILECAGCGFDLDGFVEAGKASLTLLDDLGRSQVVTSWRSCSGEEPANLNQPDDPGPVRRVSNAFMRLSWREKSLDALQIKWSDMMVTQSICFLLADSLALAEEFYTAVCEWSAVPHSEVLVFEQGNWRKDRSLFQAIRNSTFDNLVLASGLKEALRADVQQFFSRREVYSRLGVPWKRGLLLLGPPGNGKTHAVKALCRESAVPALYIRSLEPQGMFHGSEHANISAMFDMARKTAPCLLILEDLDALIKPTNRSFLLNELDGFASNAGICVLATTNYPERLDPSIMDRPSRFDRKYEFGLPGFSERAEYLRLWSESQVNELRLTENGVQQVANITNGFSFAYLKELCIAAVMAWMNSSLPMPMDDIACKQAESLLAQINLASDSIPAEPQLTPKERFRKLVNGEPV